MVFDCVCFDILAALLGFACWLGILLGLLVVCAVGGCYMLLQVGRVWGCCNCLLVWFAVAFVCFDFVETRFAVV